MLSSEALETNIMTFYDALCLDPGSRKYEL